MEHVVEDAESSVPVVPFKRLTSDIHTLVVNDPGSMSARGSDGQECNVRFLRPRAAKPSALDEAASAEQDDCNEKMTMRTIELEKCEQLWINAVAGHRLHVPECQVWRPQFQHES